MKTLITATAIAVASVLAPVRADAASDFYLKIDGIPGESLAPGHQNEIDVLSFSWGVSNKRGGGGAGKANFRDLSVLKKVDKASPLLMLACATGKRSTTAVLAIACSAGDSDSVCYRITLEDVIVSGFTTDAANVAEDGTPIETVSLSFTKIVIEYTPQSGGIPGSTIRAGWDLKQNKRIE